jgi:hypothetical protein
MPGHGGTRHGEVLREVTEHGHWGYSPHPGCDGDWATWAPRRKPIFYFSYQDGSVSAICGIRRLQPPTQYLWSLHRDDKPQECRRAGGGSFRLSKVRNDA